MNLPLLNEHHRKKLLRERTLLLHLPGEPVFRYWKPNVPAEKLVLLPAAVWMVVSIDVMVAAPGIWADVEEDLPGVRTMADELVVQAGPEITIVPPELPEADQGDTTPLEVPAVPEVTTEDPVVQADPEATTEDPVVPEELVEELVDVQAAAELAEELVEELVEAVPVVDPAVSTDLPLHHRQVEAKNSTKPRKHTINTERSRRSSTSILVRNR